MNTTPNTAEIANLRTGFHRVFLPRFEAIADAGLWNPAAMSIMEKADIIADLAVSEYGASSRHVVRVIASIHFVKLAK